MSCLFQVTDLQIHARVHQLAIGRAPCRGSIPNHCHNHNRQALPAIAWVSFWPYLCTFEADFSLGTLGVYLDMTLFLFSSKYSSEGTQLVQDYNHNHHYPHNHHYHDQNLNDQRIYHNQSAADPWRKTRIPSSEVAA